jgi:hypothetical protein
MSVRRIAIPAVSALVALESVRVIGDAQDDHDPRAGFGHLQRLDELGAIQIVARAIRAAGGADRERIWNLD